VEAGPPFFLSFVIFVSIDSEKNLVILILENHWYWWHWWNRWTIIWWIFEILSWSWTESVVGFQNIWYQQLR